MKQSTRVRRDLLLVLGMHRSGTSAMAGVLDKLGVELGDELLPPTKDNPKGYFENAKIVDAHEVMFAALGRAWHDPRPLPGSWVQDNAAVMAQRELAGVLGVLFADSGIVAVKDPRSSRVLPLWREVAEQAGARVAPVIMVRHPDEVAASLHRRDGLSRSRAHLLWARYLLDAERASRGSARVFVAYEALLRDWQGEIKRLDATFGLQLLGDDDHGVGQVDRFLDVALRNHAAGPPGGAGSGRSAFASLVLELHALALRCCDSAVEAEGAEFDAIASKIESLGAPYLDALEDCRVLDVPAEVDEEVKRQGLDRSRLEMSLQLAALRELWRPAVVAREPGPCKLYYRSLTEGFLEARAVSARPVPTEDGMTALFELPANADIEFLRVDPNDAPGVFAIQSLSLDGVVVDDLEKRVMVINELALPVATPRARIRLAALEGDPHVELDFRSHPAVAGRSRPLAVELRFKFETVLSELGEQMHDVGMDLRGNHARLRHQVGALEQQLSSLGGAVATVDAELAKAAQRAAGLEEVLGALRRELEARDKVLQDQGAEGAAAVDQLRRELEARDKVLQDQGAEGTAAVGQLRQELATAVASLDQTCRVELIGTLSGRIDEGRNDTKALAQTFNEQNQDLAREMWHLREQQAILLTWARHRSPGHWWRRLLGKH
ncbi:MAG: hypothetical protein ACREO4_15000 [Lysobacter sp.]